MIDTPNFERLGARILILRLVDVIFTKEAKDVYDALEEIKKQELARESQVIEADARLRVQEKDSAALVVKSEAELTEARNKALALNAAIAAFVGKRVDEITKAEDGEKYARYQIGMRVAESLEKASKVIVPADQISKTLAGLVNVFDATRSSNS